MSQKTTKPEKVNKRKLNIAMVCDPIGSNKSGVVVSTLRFAKLLKKRGHNIVFIGAHGKEHKGKTHHEGIRIHSYRGLPVPKGGGWHFAFPTGKELKKVFKEEKIDVIHVVLPMSSGIVAIRAAKALNIKIIVASHSQPENLFMDMPKFIQPTLNKLWNKYLAWLYRKADMIIYPAEFGRKLLHHLVGKEKPSTIISNGVNVDEYKPTEVGDFHTRFNIPKDTINIVYVGRLYPEKSIDTLIKAVPHIMKEHSNIHVMLAGAGHVRPKLEKLVESLNLNKHVTFLGLISDEDKVLAYNAGDIFISPSFAELEGMTVLEAMACGKPIIVPDAEMNAARFFVDNNGFLFETANHVDLAEKALKLIQDPELRKKMGEASLEKSKKYAIHKNTEILEETYYQVLEN
jgi:glycosyltransferase involved in cell wall biosynthesis